MTFYIATVGNDPAPVALGFLEAQARAQGRLTRAVLCCDPARGNPLERQRALEEWLRQQGVTVQHGLEALQGAKLGGSVFNVTGGQKPSVLPLLQMAKANGGAALVVDAHGDELLIHDLLKKTSVQGKRHLDLQDYTELYLTPLVFQSALMQPAPKQTFPTELQKFLGSQAVAYKVAPPVHRMDKSRSAWGVQDLTLWWVVQDSRLLLVWDVRRLPLEKIQERLRLLHQKTREVGGQLATPVFWLSQVADPLRDFILDDLRAQWIDGKEWCSPDAQSPDAPSPAPVPDLELAPMPKAQAVYAALLGAQPMPPLVGLQAQEGEPERIYLLCTPQVRQTGERLAKVLEGRSEWAGCIFLLPVEAQNPISIRHQLDKIRNAHADAALSVNLSGGTKALALHAELWAEEQSQQQGGSVQTEYTDGHVVQGSGAARQPLWHLTLDEELRVRGVEVSESRPLPPSIPLLRQTAKALFTRDTPENRTAFWRALQQHLPEQFQPKDVTAGLAGEYLGITDLAARLPAGRVREMVWATKLTFPTGGKREIDGLAVLDDGKLLILEVKRNLESGIETDSEHGQTPALAERLAGLHAHSLLIGRVRGGSNSEHWQQACQQVGPLSSNFASFSLWAMQHGGRPLPANVKRFPEDLADFLSRERPDFRFLSGAT